MILIGILIFFLTILVCWQIIAATMPLRLVPLREGLESEEPTPTAQEPLTTQEPTTSSVSAYQPYNKSDLSNNATALPKQNASNIDYLHGQVITLNSSNTKNQQSINSMQTQIDALTKQQVEYAQSIGKPETEEETEEENYYT